MSLHNGTEIKIGIPKMRRFSDIERKKLEWLWPGRIPMGKLTVIAGDPGFGKSLLTVAMASTVTNEAKWPDCGEYAPFGSVVLLSAEDDDADTIKPRLIAAQADESKVLSLDSVVELETGKRGFCLDTDIGKLAKALQAVSDCRLLVIDPISAFMGSIDSHNVADVRGVLAELSELAQRRQIAVLYVTHLNKGKGTPMARVSGSGAYVAAARSGMLVGRDPLDPERRVLAMLKANLSTEASGVAYRIRADENGLPVVEWEPGPVDISAEDLLGHESGHNRREREEAIQWLAAELSHGPVDSKRIQSLASQAGHAWRTVLRAKSDLKVESKRVRGPNSKWQWWHPDDVFRAHDKEDCLSSTPSQHGEIGIVGNVQELCSPRLPT